MDAFREPPLAVETSIMFNAKTEASPTADSQKQMTMRQLVLVAFFGILKELDEPGNSDDPSNVTNIMRDTWLSLSGWSRYYVLETARPSLIQRMGWDALPLDEVCPFELDEILGSFSSLWRRARKCLMTQMTAEAENPQYDYPSAFKRPTHVSDLQEKCTREKERIVMGTSYDILKAFFDDPSKSEQDSNMYTLWKQYSAEERCAILQEAQRCSTRSWSPGFSYSSTNDSLEIEHGNMWVLRVDLTERISKNIVSSVSIRFSWVLS
ncbi:hypothetical protein BDN70DRAFT_992282 [Pholiota conissans]|uniref:Uncharacterized protein n=1 Tax=Pholiota conissans TaxID=109636 RepID=A0A9P5Z6H4_9AGAR|nr:hypothetical protein BDN70DRAFT_992282 [Pholiota conissans]